jgi:hypothetical protein
MGSKIEWETSLDKARERARSEQKPILLDFFNPG